MISDYESMTKEQLIDACRKKDQTIFQTAQKSRVNYGKSDIMSMFGCEGNKALRILKLMWQMGYGIKVGKEYYIEPEKYAKWMDDFSGKEVFI